MDFIIGGSYQGKSEYVFKNYDYKNVFYGETSEMKELEQADVILSFHFLIKRMLQAGMDQNEITELVGKIQAKVIVADEIGYGLVPIDSFERMYREEAGRLCCQIAKQANKVIRIVCGVPSVIKNDGIKIYLIRHGFTQGNEEARYVGRTDESLSENGREKLTKLASEIAEIKPDVLFVSPMKRCIETADILFKDVNGKIVDDFRECDFGDFEYKNYRELNGNEAYQEFIDSNGMTGFPGGELPEAFRERCQDAFLKVIEKLKECPDIQSVAFVVHGGTIMSILDAFSKPHKDYFSWQIGNGNGYFGKLLLEEERVTCLQKICEF